MKNFTNLFLIGILLFGLGCKCSELFGEKRKSIDIDVSAPSNSSEPAADPVRTPKTDIDVSAPEKLSTGDYTGTARNQTTGTSGDILLRITSYDPAKNTVKAYFEASNGLSGEGNIGGIYNAQTNALSLFGTVSGGVIVMMSGKVSGRMISGTYTIGNKQNGFQRGEFTASKW